MEPPSLTGEQDPAPRRYGRGVFLATVAGGLTSLFWGKAAWDHVTGFVSPVASAVAPILPTGGWRIYTISGHMPAFDPATWRLTIGGQVEQPASLTYGQLKALPRVEQVSNFHCVTGWSVDNVRWAGVRLHDVLAQAKPLAAGHALRFTSMEVPYVDYLTLQQASLRDVMLAYEMDGEPLAQEHGAPLRLVIPEMYGYKNVKWLERIDVVPRVEAGYWEQLGYDQDAWVGRSNGYGT
ncbi:MAG TPA: molybdopterin-dependent oxidoreductase [Gaiellaceae bacterium]|nr:molybdopterin-dependent oxidoreductase [Gaiellaceae bacterium]